ncbi:unnamed protein product [Absidia cylindrospora]
MVPWRIFLERLGKYTNYIYLKLAYISGVPERSISIIHQAKKKMSAYWGGLTANIHQFELKLGEEESNTSSKVELNTTIKVSQPRSVRRTSIFFGPHPTTNLIPSRIFIRSTRSRLNAPICNTISYIKANQRIKRC